MGNGSGLVEGNDNGQHEQKEQLDGEVLRAVEVGHGVSVREAAEVRVQVGCVAKHLSKDAAKSSGDKALEARCCVNLAMCMKDACKAVVEPRQVGELDEAQTEQARNDEPVVEDHGGKGNGDVGEGLDIELQGKLVVPVAVGDPPGAGGGKRWQELVEEGLDSELQGKGRATTGR